MKIFISILFLFVSNKVDQNKVDKDKVEYYHPTYQDYKFWTEEKNSKETFIEKNFSIKKYYSHNFFKHDNIGFFFRYRKILSIPNRYKQLNQENFNANMPKNMLFFKDPFFYREKIKYFDVKTPISEIFYISDFFKKKKILGGFFSQNFNKKINYSIEYRNFYLENEFDLKESKNLLLTTFNYQDKDDYNYKLWGHYINQKFEIEDKKITPKWNIKNYKNVFLSHKEFFQNRFYISLIQKISSFKEKNRSFLLKTYMEYEKYSNQNLQKQKINHSYLRNSFFLIFNHKKMNIEIGSIFDKINYQLFNNNHKKDKEINSFSIQTKVFYPINNIFEFYSNGKWIIENYKKSYLKTNIMLNVFLLPKFLFLTQLSINENNNLIPIFIMNKNKDCYNSHEEKNIFFFEKEKTINFSLSSHEKKYYISFYISRLNHFLRHEEKKIKEFLYPKHIQLYGFNIKTTHDLWRFQFNNILLYQKYNSNPLIFSVPNFILRSTIFYQDYFFHKALFVKTGFSFHYFNEFYSKKVYYPFNFQTFSFDKECIPNKIGGRPFLDYFFNFKIYKTIFYFNIQNIGFYDNENKFFIKIGFLWNLFT
ncbi:putative porin [Blattabacterium cuenoti]|uniref:putative porin n=1 Tax=Blattabacterium cuenoti TaxID=1653831 RepID=UPI00163D3CA9|nr:putative porin [Blattabacterium cuenoti]